jgi:hypothetical protein
MKSHLFLSAFVLSAVILFTFRFNEKQKQFSVDLTEFKKKNIIRCGPDWDKLKNWLEETDIPPIPGAGIYKWKISTRNDSAQFYFNQGINMYYSFHIIEAMASFKKAEKFDKYSPMLLWAQALTYGPNINDFGYTASPEALSASGKAIEFSGRCTDKEIALIEAQRVRYSYDSSQTRVMLNQHYVDKMKEVYEKFPGDADVATLYADAMMLQHPWDYWKHNGYWLFDSPEVIRGVAKENSVPLEGTFLFYYEVYEMEFDGQQWRAYQPESSFPTNVVPPMW